MFQTQRHRSNIISCLFKLNLKTWFNSTFNGISSTKTRLITCCSPLHLPFTTSFIFLPSLTRISTSTQTKRLISITTSNNKSIATRFFLSTFSSSSSSFSLPLNYFHPFDRKISNLLHKITVSSTTLSNKLSHDLLLKDLLINNNKSNFLTTLKFLSVKLLSLFVENKVFISSIKKTGSIQSFVRKGTTSGSSTTSRSLFPSKKNNNKVSSVNETFSKRFYSTTTTTTTQIKMAPIEIDDKIDYDYDLIVIGGGSGGLAASKEAAALGKKVCMLDFVKPSPRGSTWGVGGTCVNVGCIPKKLMHHASLIGGEIDDAHFFGWQTKDGKPLKENLKHDWSTLVTYVQNNVKSSNFSYRAILATQKVKYINAYGSFVEPHKIRIVYKNSKEEFLTSKHFIVATGERPVYPSDCEGAEQYAITSDDLFSLRHDPGRTLVIGASYVALECAGFLRGLGYDVSVMVRSIVLRGFDRQCSEQIRNYMENFEHVKFIDHCVMKKIEEIRKSENGEPPLLRVTYRNLDTNEETVDEYNTVMFAVGRKPCTNNIGLDIAGVKMDEKGYIPVVNEQTNVPHIFAIGDILQGKPQLTPVAIEAGVLLARRLYADQNVNCDYINVPTTVFTPIEYGCCGYTEEEAIDKFGADNIEVYHQYFTPTEWKLNYYDRPRKPMNVCYAKVITTRSLEGDPTKEILLGFHYVGPNAGEVIQFTPFPLKMKATKADLDALIGIHPTCAEIFTMLPISKRSGKEATQQGCCG